MGSFISDKSRAGSFATLSVHEDHDAAPPAKPRSKMAAAASSINRSVANKAAFLGDKFTSAGRQSYGHGELALSHENVAKLQHGERLSRLQYGKTLARKVGKLAAVPAIALGLVLAVTSGGAALLAIPGIMAGAAGGALLLGSLIGRKQAAMPNSLRSHGLYYTGVVQSKAHSAAVLKGLLKAGLLERAYDGRASIGESTDLEAIHSYLLENRQAMGLSARAVDSTVTYLGYAKSVLPQPMTAPAAKGAAEETSAPLDDEDDVAEAKATLDRALAAPEVTKEGGPLT